MLTERERERLQNVFGQFPEVRAVYLFGSAAEGRRGPESDLDLGVLADEEAFAEHKLELLTELARAGIDEVDLLLLNTADTVTRFEAVRPNMLIYRSGDFDHDAFYSLVVRKYLDLKPYLERQRAAYKERLRRGST